jgi:hypothetical protein
LCCRVVIFLLTTIINGFYAVSSSRFAVFGL